MAKMIQIRDVPDTFHQELKARAALAGQSLSEYLLALLRQASSQATPEEMRAILRSRRRYTLEESSADIIRERRGPLP
ncbi:MAG: hypothetical protein MJB57_13185 [Gemmatimonadetes bacterium]|nr:hypothetical protein [Gemmatimonadota bacterium]